MRRWVAVACVWAVAASAIAGIALLEQRSGDADEDRGLAALRRDLVRERRALDRRLGSIEASVRSARRSSSDLAKLERRLERVEERVGRSAAASGRTERSVAGLERRLERLERARRRR